MPQGLAPPHGRLAAHHPVLNAVTARYVRPRGQHGGERAWRRVDADRFAAEFGDPGPQVVEPPDVGLGHGAVGLAEEERLRATDFATSDLDDDGLVGVGVRTNLAQRLAVKDDEFHSLGLVLGYDYPDSPVVVPDGRGTPPRRLRDYVPSAHPGARLPHAWLPGGRSIYDLLGERFTLVRCDPHAPVPGELPVVDAAHLRGGYEADLLLVRPDQHVAWRGTVLSGDLVARAAGQRPAKRG